MNVDDQELRTLLDDDVSYESFINNEGYEDYILREYDCQIDQELQRVTDANALIEAFNKAKGASQWKESVQHYEANLLKQTHDLKKEVETNTYKQRDFRTFTINERGKTRYIKALDVRDRILQRSLCDNILTPKIGKTLIYDNGASVKEKGQSFTEERLYAHLQKYYKEYGPNGYILKLDYSKFFDNIIHENLIHQVSNIINSKSTIELCKDLISSFDIDVSYMSDDEFKTCYNTLFNHLEYIKTYIDCGLDKSKMMHKSIGIGSQISQIFGLLYLSYDVDQFCKYNQGLKYYGRYADDLYTIHYSKDYLNNLYSILDEKSSNLGLFINKNKTQIIKLSQGFVFLKIRYVLKENGQILRIPSKSKFYSERNRLRGFARLVEKGEMSYIDAKNSYKSWRGTLEKYDCHDSLHLTDDLFYQLFGEPWYA